MPVEMFGSVDFPPVGQEPYFLSLGPHSFLWLQLRDDRPASEPAAPRAILERPRAVEDLTGTRRTAELTGALQAWMTGRRWYRGRTRRIRSLSIGDTIPVPITERSAAIVLVDVEYTEGDPDRYVVVLALHDTGMSEDDPTRIADLVRNGDPAGYLIDAATDPDVVRWLVTLVKERGRARGKTGELIGRPTKALPAMLPPDEAASVRPFRGEQSNTSSILDERSILKVFRLLEAGENPDVEIGRFLTGQGFPNVPAVGGWVDHRRRDGTVASLATLQAFVPNEGDVWEVARAAVDGFLDVALQSGAEAPHTDTRIETLLAASLQPRPDEAGSLVGSFVDLAELLGTRTGELHRVLASGTDPAIAPEALNSFHQRSLYQSVRGLASGVARTLQAELPRLPAQLRPEAEEVLALLPRVERRLQPLLDEKLGGQRIRVHGDFHQGQVLRSGNDVILTDFEGEPLRPLSERRLRRPALTDVAGMIRSFHYAAHGALVGRGDPDRGQLARWADLWFATISVAFLRAYREATAGTGLLPTTEVAVAHLLDALLLQKAVYELRYELSARPDWLPIPMRGIRDALGDG
jgi:maltose alpha-D-glucosyltransferase/alpha-amylase